MPAPLECSSTFIVVATASSYGTSHGHRTVGKERMIGVPRGNFIFGDAKRPPGDAVPLVLGTDSKIIGGPGGIVMSDAQQNQVPTNFLVKAGIFGTILTRVHFVVDFAFD